MQLTRSGHSRWRPPEQFLVFGGTSGGPRWTSGSRSPSFTRRLHIARFIYAGEARFGPPYFVVELNGRILRRWFQKRHFGYRSQWSPDSRYLAVQEWRDLVEQPHTELRVLDMSSGRETRVARARGGFVEPVQFEGVATLTYETAFYNRERGSTVESRTVDLSPPAGTNASRAKDASS
jgi:hypothetical protein